jgi:phosphatidylglycerol:prolipoprotein diacylglycerol transferase
MIMLGVVVGTWLAAKFAERRGIPADDVYSAALWIVVAGIVGARAAHVIDRFDFYRANPGKILAIYEGGLAIWGGLIAGGLGGWAYTRRYNVPFWPFADAVAHGAIFGQAIGRIGCIVNGDVAGKPTNGDWGFVYTNPNALLPRPEYFNTPTHPYPLYEMAWDLALFGLLFLVARKVKMDGAVFLAYVVLYSLGRFLLTFTREEEIFLFGLQQAQVFSLIAIVIAAYLYLFLRGRPGARRLRPRQPRVTAAGA